MASHWVKSLQCKSTAFHDVIHPNPNPNPNPNPKPKKPSSLPIISCSNSVSDAVSPQNPNPPKPKRPKSPRPKKPTKSPTLGPPALSELPPGHSSRRVVELIFTSSWAPTGPFPGRIHIVFRVHNPTRTLARFEDYRAAVRSGAAGDVRCAVDGNEMMRFHCSGEINCDSGIRTFEGSGGAHESGGSGLGRRAMLVSRVITGRVRSGAGSEAGGDSVAVGNGGGEIVVFDSRAVLPCFLIIYEI